MVSNAVVTQQNGNTPLMRQYYRIKAQHPDSMLLFRMGDFYETFDADAIEASRILGIALTKRSNGAAHDVPLAGFPHHALENYLPTLVDAGKRVALCEQLENVPAKGKLVRRGVVEVVTPGVTLHHALLDPLKPRYLAAVCWQKAGAGLAYADASTGEFALTEVALDGLPSMLESLRPAELLIDRTKRHEMEALAIDGARETILEDWVFTYDYGHELLRDHFQTHSLRGFGVTDQRAGVVAAGAVLHYLKETQQGDLSQIQRLACVSSTGGMALDRQTRRNLDLEASESSSDGALVELIDETLTASGGRMLRRWLMRPLTDVKTINHRLEAVSALYDRRRDREALRELLKGIGDLERLAGRVCTGRASPRDLVAIADSLERAPRIQNLFEEEACPELRTTAGELRPLPDVVSLIRTAIVDHPPVNKSSGDIFRAGYNAVLDKTRQLARSGKEYLAQLQKREADATGITSLKVGYNKVFGYFLEVTNVHKDKVPSNYERKQTLVNAERYVTSELKEYEEQILTAEVDMLRLERELMKELLSDVAEFASSIQETAQAIAALDCYAAFAAGAETRRYCKPVVDSSHILRIENGRHPVVERAMPMGEAFVPNTIHLDAASSQIHIITGPNMAGKSVALRQVGMIVLLAQAGSFVPATSAHIGLVDRIFTRVGASDHIARGESTFLVEMNETANILHNATRRSLILLDEVGRGTSTFDGLSIAWALVEHIHKNPEVAARTLFATHFHELNELADQLQRVKNYRVDVQEHGGKVIFLRRLKPGAADHSFGIEVAKMAGLPSQLIERARVIMSKLEAHQELTDNHDGEQMSLFPGDEPNTAVIDQLSQIKINNLTPLEALTALAELKAKI